jgi:AcrR family transcriptional regulator
VPRVKLTPRKQPRQGRSRATVEAILQATTYILTKRGVDGLTTNAVAERAGVNIATLYQYFPNKEALVAELGRRHVVQTRAAALAVLEEPARGHGIAAAVRAAIDALIASHRVDPTLHRILTQQALRNGAKRLATESDAPLHELGRRWLESAGGRFERPELTLWLAATAAHSVLHAALLERPELLDDPAFSEELSRLIARYLRA